MPFSFVEEGVEEPLVLLSSRKEDSSILKKERGRAVPLYRWNNSADGRFDVVQYLPVGADPGPHFGSREELRCLTQQFKVE